MTQDRAFQIGDVVQLRSGGPRMTVVAPADLALVCERKPTIECHWFNGARLDWARFSAAALALVSAASRETRSATRRG